MRSACALASALVLLLVPIASAVENVTCYAFDGSKWENNFVCEGSSACCGVDGICMPNKLCNSKKDGTGELIRGPCAVKPYDVEECAEICLYDEINKHFPRVTKCKDSGKYCCNNDKNCCAEGRGVLLNAAGKVIKSKETTSDTESKKTTVTRDPSALPSDSTTPGTTATPPTIPTPAAPVAPNPATPSPPNVPTGASGGLATGAKIGLGVGIPVGVLALAGLAAFLWFRRKKNRVYSGSNGGYSPPPQTHEMAADEGPQEMQGYAKGQSNEPIELYAKEQSHAPVELPAEVPAEEGGNAVVQSEYKPYVRGA